MFLPELCLADLQTFGNGIKNKTVLYVPCTSLQRNGPTEVTELSKIPYMWCFAQGVSFSGR